MHVDGADSEAFIVFNQVQMMWQRKSEPDTVAWIGSKEDID